MQITDQAQMVDYLGSPQLVIEDEALLSWAARNGVAPHQAQLQALEAGLIPLRYLKNFLALDHSQQTRVCRSSVLVCGCGGLGGVVGNLLVRAGVGRVRFVDSDVFVTSNLNRQWLCDIHQISRAKAVVAEEWARAISPFVEIESHCVAIDETNCEALIAGMDLVLDALDNIHGRFVISEASRRLGVAFIHAAIAGWWGQISTFLPGSTHTLRDIYGERRIRDRSEEAAGVLGPTASVIASLEAMEALRFLSGKKPVYSGQLLYFDGESGRMEFIAL